MKKLVLELSGILLFIYLLLTLLSFRGSYVAERELWKIDRKFSNLALHEESAPEFTFDRIAQEYREYAKKYKGTVHACRARLMLGNLYALRKDYGRARQEYQQAIGLDNDLSAKADYSMAKTWEIEGQWEKAVSLYYDMMNKYPLTDFGFMVPLYLAGHVEETGSQEDTQRAYGNALNFYMKVAAQNPKSKFEFNALRMAVVCRLHQQRWRDAANTMGELILKYPTAKAIEEAVSSINIICVTKLHDYDLGIRLYRQFLLKYPNHPVSPILKKMVADLQTLKAKNLVIQTAPKASSR